MEASAVILWHAFCATLVPTSSLRRLPNGPAARAQIKSSLPHVLEHSWNKVGTKFEQSWHKVEAICTLMNKVDAKSVKAQIVNDDRGFHILWNYS